MSSDNEEDSPELAALRRRTSLACLVRSAQAAARNRGALSLVGSGALVSPEHLALRLPRLEELEREQAKQITDEWTEVGRQMRCHREAAGISLRKLAAMLRVSPPFLSDMERGFRRYTFRHAGPALKIFGANTADQRRSPEQPTHDRA